MHGKGSGPTDDDVCPRCGTWDIVKMNFFNPDKEEWSASKRWDCRKCHAYWFKETGTMLELQPDDRRADDPNYAGEVL